MQITLRLPHDLETRMKDLASEAGLDLSEYAIQLLRAELVQESPQKISEEQFNESLRRLQQIHANASTTFDDSRDSMY